MISMLRVQSIRLLRRSWESAASIVPKTHVGEPSNLCSATSRVIREPRIDHRAYASMPDGGVPGERTVAVNNPPSSQYFLTISRHT